VTHVGEGLIFLPDQLRPRPKRERAPASHNFWALHTPIPFWPRATKFGNTRVEGVCFKGGQPRLLFEGSGALEPQICGPHLDPTNFWASYMRPHQILHYETRWHETFHGLDHAPIAWQKFNVTQCWRAICVCVCSGKPC